MSKVPASFLQCRDAAQRCKKMDALCKIRNHHKGEIRKVALMLRILTDQERAEHRRLLRHGLQPKGNNYKGKKDKPKVDGNCKGENKGLKGSAKWKEKQKPTKGKKKDRTENPEERRRRRVPLWTSKTLARTLWTMLATLSNGTRNDGWTSA